MVTVAILLIAAFAIVLAIGAVVVLIVRTVGEPSSIELPETSIDSFQASVNASANDPHP